MIERHYRCDLCREEYDREDLVPIRWIAGTDGDVLIKADETSSGPSERHLCRKCIACIKELS